MTNQPRTDLILQLSNHLLNGKLGHETFSFFTYNTHPKGKTKKETDCGTFGDAIGELPIIKPDEFKFCGNKVVWIPSSLLVNSVFAFRQIFNLSVEDAITLWKITHDYSLYNQLVEKPIYINKEHVAKFLFEFATDLETKYFNKA